MSEILKTWRTHRAVWFGVVTFFSIFFILALFNIAGGKPVEYVVKQDNNVLTQGIIKESDVSEPIFSANYIDTPDPLKGLYMTNWVGGVRNEEGEFYRRESLMDLIDKTELNAIVVDIKDDTGNIGFEVFDEKLIGYGSATKRIPDIRDFIKELHDRNIYVIGRIAVFQDPYLAKNRPDLAIKRTSDGAVWKDRKGLSWLDPASKEVWDYVLLIARDARTSGFDEIQFDYVRFPTDGDISNMSYPFYDPTTKTKSDQIAEFFSYIASNINGEFPISADLFGLTTTASDDLGIGQILETATKYFDYVSPMVYPSHYAPGSFGFQNPNNAPYEIIKQAMIGGVEKLNNATTSPNKLRPWLQDFDYGGSYGVKEVQDQIKGVYDAGLTSWLMWDPSNKYTREAFLSE